MAKVHFFLQGKGGVGKSFCITMLAQYLFDQGLSPICIDTDPVNKTFSAYERFHAKKMDITKNGKIDQLKFDTIVEIIDKAGDEDSILVDNGASSFVVFSDYLLKSDVPGLLAELGHIVTIHTVVTGGDEQGDTIKGFEALAMSFKEPTRMVLWLNPYFGAVEFEGKSFEEFKVYKENKHRVNSLLYLPNWDDNFRFNVGQMLKSRLTFSEALADSTSPIMTGQRLKLAKQHIENVISKIEVL